MKIQVAAIGAFLDAVARHGGFELAPSDRARAIAIGDRYVTPSELGEEFERASASPQLVKALLEPTTEQVSGTIKRFCAKPGPRSGQYSYYFDIFEKPGKLFCITDVDGPGLFMTQRGDSVQFTLATYAPKFETISMFVNRNYVDDYDAVSVRVV